jgi:BirA family biotin operon repressor/biotin-[acetyl-CoA-carboxylase] ligase
VSETEWRIEREGSVGSTNDLLVARARAGESEGLVIVADFQEAGRGRRDRSWMAPPGSALLMSVLLRPGGGPDQYPWALVALALSARSALEAWGRVDLKWPNDLLIEEKKLGGLLAQVVGERVVVGLGLNLVAPGENLVEATSVAGAWGVRLGRDEVLERVLAELTPRAERLQTREGRAQLREEYRDALATLGRRVRGHLETDVISGVARDVDEWGRLVVVGDATWTLSAADVVHLRGDAE